MLRSVETQPLTGGFVLMVGRILFIFFNFSKLVNGGSKVIRLNSTSPKLGKYKSIFSVCSTNSLYFFQIFYDGKPRE